MNKAVILMGSNWDADHNLQAATEALRNAVALRLETTSGVFTSPAVASSGEVDPSLPEYQNMAALVSTSLTPLSLRSELRTIEQRLGRDRGSKRFDKIAIDLDVVVFDNMNLIQDGLQLPDPAIDRFAFAAIPVAEVIPQWIHPIRGISYAAIADNLRANVDNTRRTQ